MVISRSDFKYYLTSAEFDVPQANYAMSIGGYKSTTNVYPEVSLYSTVSIYDNVLPNGIQGCQYLSIEYEMIKMSLDNPTVVLERSFNSSRDSHIQGDVIRGLNDDFFNSDLSHERKQYRCICVKNEGDAEDIAYTMGVYIKQNSLNPQSSFRIAVEIPRHNIVEGRSSTVNSTDSMSLIDGNLSESFEDNIFSGSVLSFESGLNINQSVVIASYDSSLKKIIFESSLPYAVLSGDNYYISPSPAQRISTGIVSPNVGSGLITNFLNPGLYNPISLNVGGQRVGGSNFSPNDLFYIWVERTINKNSETFNANNLVIALTYLTGI